MRLFPPPSESCDAGFSELKTILQEASYCRRLVMSRIFEESAHTRWRAVWLCDAPDALGAGRGIPARRRACATRYVSHRLPIHHPPSRIVKRLCSSARLGSARLGAALTGGRPACPSLPCSRAEPKAEPKAESKAEPKAESHSKNKP